MSQIFNIFGELEKEIDDFDNGGVYIVGKPSSDHETQTQRGTKGGYYHSQKHLLEAIDLASASKYKHGIYDDEGQRKTFLNIVNFYRDVMKMKIKISVVNYIFEPLSLDFSWIVWLFDRTFKVWAVMNDYDDQIDELGHDLSTYGTTVVKRLSDCTERVPLRTLRNTQTAKSLKHAALYGGYVIIENEFHFNQMTEYPDWNVSNLSKNGTYCTYERYALIPSGLLDIWDTATSQEISRYTPSEDEEMVCAMAIIILEGAGTGAEAQKLVFLEKIDEDTFTLEECHAERVDGRWMGKGEIEKQLENQIARNLNANMRQRGILWATKKLFYSTDEDVQDNLVMEVRDGQVLKVRQGGQIAPLNTSSQHTGEIDNDDKAWQENSRQNAFAFEVATGEAMPSGTPFRLGVVLQQAVADHFTGVRKTFANFLVRVYFAQLIPIFKQEYRDEHDAIVSLGESDIENMKDDIITYHTNLRTFNAVMQNKRPDPDAIRQEVTAELTRNAYAFISVPAGAYDRAESYMKLNLVDDISPDISDLTSLYESMTQKNDPRAEGVLKMIFAKKGKSLDATLGPAPAAASAQPQANAAAMPAVNTEPATPPMQ